MMADNEQNTYAGGAGDLVRSTGNGFLDLFSKLASVAVTGVGAYEDVQDRRAAREIELANSVNPPQQALPASQANSPAGYLSNANSVQSMLLFGAGVLLIGGLSFWAMKKL